MKVSGPNSESGVGPPEAATGSGPTEVAGGAEGRSRLGSTAEATGTAETTAPERAGQSGQAFAEKLAAKTAEKLATGAPGPGPATTGARAPAGDTTAIAADLDAGRLAPAAAVDKLLEQVLTRQLGSDATPAIRERVRAALRDALENDPLLAEKLGRLDV